MAVKIMIDPGHFSGVNRYTAIGGSTNEGDVVWDISQMLIPMLRSYGFTVGCTKPSINAYPGAPGEDNITARGRMAAGYDLLLSLHTNAAESASVNRPVVIYPVNGAQRDLAARIGAKLQSVGGWQNYQIFSRWNSSGNADYYGVIRGAAAVGVPGLIIEHTFHTNPSAASWLSQSANRRKIAQAVADTVAMHYGYGGNTPSEPEGEIYRVRKNWADASSQIGAYRDLQSAKSVADANSGYYVFDGKGTAIYPTDTGETVPPGHSSITRYEFQAEAITPVYSDTMLRNQIGYLNSGEVVSCIEAGGSLMLVWYELDSGEGWKAGYVRRGDGRVY